MKYAEQMLTVASAQIIALTKGKTEFIRQVVRLAREK